MKILISKRLGKKGKLIFLTFLMLIVVTTYYYLSNVKVKTVSLNISTFEEKTSNMKFIVGGNITGIKLLSKGVLVIGVDNLKIDLNIGDVILKVGNYEINSNKELIEKINDKSNFNNGKVKLSILRKDKEKEIFVEPKYSDDLQKYEIGIYVKDSSAGVGTITFYEKTSNKFAGLGHAITESSENILVDITSGAIVKSEIDKITKSTVNMPGDIRGKIYKDVLGEILYNTENGIYGNITDVELIEKIKNSEEIQIAKKEEIKEGKAYILCSLEKDKLTKYEINIEKVFLDSKGNKNIIINIIDKQLLELTGGIIQGMSGTPIIQDGKLIGAITHVFLDDPTRGYAVFIENMIKDMLK